MCVYQEGSSLVVDPKPVLNYTRRLEYGKTVHVVTTTLFKIPYGQLGEGVTLYPKEVKRQTYTRTYSYSGVSEVRINGEKTASSTVEKNSVLELVIILRIWGVKT